jgi:hypothetical protein
MATAGAAIAFTTMVEEAITAMAAARPIAVIMAAGRECAAADRECAVAVVDRLMATQRIARPAHQLHMAAAVAAVDNMPVAADNMLAVAAVADNMPAAAVADAGNL